MRLFHVFSVAFLFSLFFVVTRTTTQNNSVVVHLVVLLLLYYYTVVPIRKRYYDTGAYLIATIRLFDIFPFFLSVDPSIDASLLFVCRIGWEWVRGGGNRGDQKRSSRQQ